MWSKIEETRPNELYDQADLLTKNTWLPLLIISNMPKSVLEKMAFNQYCIREMITCWWLKLFLWRMDAMISIFADHLVSQGASPQFWGFWMKLYTFTWKG